MLEDTAWNLSQIEDLCFAAKKMTGDFRWAFQGRICQKYFEGNVRKTEKILGWGRRKVKLGIEEQRSGIICVGRQSTHSGTKKWEEKQPEAAESLRKIAESYAQQNPTFNNPIAYTRLTASEARKQLKFANSKMKRINLKSWQRKAHQVLSDH